MIREENGTHFEGDKVYFIDGKVTFKELAELIIHLYRNEDARIVKYPDMNPENFQGRKMLQAFLDEALARDKTPIDEDLLRKYRLS